MDLRRCAGIGVLVVSMALPVEAADLELFCAKPATIAWDDSTTIACYSDSGCAYAESLGAYVARDYDLKSVVAALGREKIDGVVTSSSAIVDAVKGFGYACAPLGR